MAEHEPFDDQQQAVADRGTTDVLCSQGTLDLVNEMLRNPGLLDAEEARRMGCMIRLILKI